jgi:hypothetical protein
LGYFSRQFFANSAHSKAPPRKPLTANSKKEKMGKKTHYVVKEGRKPGIYTSWPDTQKQVNGFSGAVFKGFSSKSEAMEWYGRGTAEQSSPPPLSTGLQTHGLASAR